MSRRDKVIYYTLLGVSRPVTACCLSRKKHKHKQRLAFKHMIGDMMLGAPMMLVRVNEPLTVNHIMDSSLGPFIEFAANDCGYGGSVKELVCN